jgi:hypothetical protein
MGWREGACRTRHTLCVGHGLSVVLTGRTSRSVSRPRGGSRWRSVRTAARVLLAGAAASGIGFAAGNMLSPSGSGETPTIGDLTVSADFAPAAPQVLFPHGAVDVVVNISNPNTYPVTITKMELPRATTFATGYATADLRVPVPACGPSATGSDVTWHWAAATRRSSRVLARGLVIAATGQIGDPLAVTLLAAAVMGTTSSPTCEGAYLLMPRLVGLTATLGGEDRVGAKTAVDEWKR